MPATASAKTKGPRRHLLIDPKLPQAGAAGRSSHRRRANYMQKSRRLGPEWRAQPLGGPRRRQIQSDMQFLQPLGRNRRRCVHQQVLRLLVHRKATTSRRFGVSASSMTMRSMPPGAEPPCGGAPYLKALSIPAETRLDLLGRIAGDRKGLIHDLRAVVADRPRGELDPIADDVVLVRRNFQRILLARRRQAAPRHRERVVAGVRSLPVSSLRSYIGKSVIQQKRKAPSSISPSSWPILVRAALASFFAPPPWTRPRKRPRPLRRRMRVRRSSTTSSGLRLFAIGPRPVSGPSG